MKVKVCEKIIFTNNLPFNICTAAGNTFMTRF